MWSLCLKKRHLKGKLTFTASPIGYRGISKEQNGKRRSGQIRSSRRLYVCWRVYVCVCVTWCTLWYWLDDISLALLGIYRLTWKLNERNPTCSKHYTSFAQEWLTFRNRKSLYLRFITILPLEFSRTILVTFWSDRGRPLRSFTG